MQIAKSGIGGILTEYAITIDGKSAATIITDLQGFSRLESSLSGIYGADGGGIHVNAIDALESFLLALANNGVDLSDPRFSGALDTALEAVANHG